MQQNLIVYVLARRGGQVVAAGRAVLPEVGAGASLPFQAFLVGSPSGRGWKRAPRRRRLGERNDATRLAAGRVQGHMPQASDTRP